MPLNTQAVSFQYNESNRFEFPDLEIKESEHQLILGGSGRGKTTLLHLLGGLLRPSSGQIRINQTDITELSEAKMDQFRGKHISFVFQRSYFVKSLNVKDNLLLAQKLSGQKQSTTEIQQRLDDLQIDLKLNAMPNQLSVGEQQRVSIVRAVLSNPSVILADEPTSALDDDNAYRVWNLLERSASAGNANLIIVTHDQRLKKGFHKVIEL